MSFVTTCPTCKSTFVGRTCLSCAGQKQAPAKAGPASPLLPIGEEFRGMEIIEKVDQGGMGTIYRARRISDGKIVALKVICPEVDFSGDLERRFTREATALAALSHPNIVGFYESGREREFMFFSMEFVEGKTLRTRMEPGPLSVAQTSAVAMQICEAIQFTHDHDIVHRDIKPENILIDGEGSVKLADFGLAKVLGSLEESFGLTISGAALGTGAYMAPEQRIDSAGVDGRADLYATGVVMYEMLHAKLPPRLDTNPNIKLSDDSRMNAILWKALASDREKRFSSAHELKVELAQVLGENSGAPDSFLKATLVDLREAQLFKDALEEKPSSQHLPVPEEARKALENPERCLNQYILIEKVGQGGMGAVWKAWDKALARWVAVKFLSASDDTSIGRFIREAQLSAQLRHSNIAGIQEVNQSDDKHFLVMEFIDGSNLREAELTIGKALPIFVKVCRAIQFAHDRKIVHRDIKPANIMLGKDKEPYVTDFGLAKILQSESSLSATGAIIGSPAYMSPEQAGGESSEIAEKSDIYSLGATLYTLLTGKPPFHAVTLTGILNLVTTKDPVPPRERNPEIPVPVEAIIQKAMQKAKEKRYSSAGELADDLERFLRAEKVEARSPGVFSKIAQSVKKNPWPSLVVVLLVITAGFGIPLLKDTVSTPENTKEKEKASLSTEKPPDEQAAIRFESLLKWSRFSGSSPERKKEIESLLPKLNREKEISWLQMQWGLLPTELGPKKNWYRRKSEAERVIAWCTLILGLLEKEESPEFQKRLRGMKEKYAPVLAWKGMVNLRILVTPYADLQSLRVGDDWIVREGKVSNSTTHFPSDGLSTPFTIEDLDIEKWTFTFVHPIHGEKTWEIFNHKDLIPGKTYILAGSWRGEGSLRLR